MSCPLKHHQALDIAEDILKYLVERDDQEEMCDALKITGADIVEAYNVVKGMRELVDNQRY